jgi:hypothetical protein
MQRVDKKAWMEDDSDAQDAQQREWINFTAWGVGMPRVVLKCDARRLLPGSYIKWAYAQIIQWDQHLLRELHMCCPLTGDNEVDVPELLFYDPSDNQHAGKHGTVHCISAPVDMRWHLMCARSYNSRSGHWWQPEPPTIHTC